MSNEADKIALAAMVVVFAEYTPNAMMQGKDWFRARAKDAYRIADAMLAEQRERAKAEGGE